MKKFSDEIKKMPKFCRAITLAVVFPCFSPGLQNMITKSLENYRKQEEDEARKRALKR